MNISEFLAWLGVAAWAIFWFWVVLVGTGAI